MKSANSKKLLNKGFTLVELLIVIAIIGILTTIGVGSFRSARIKARDARKKSDLEQIAKSLEAYTNDHRVFPTSSNGQIVCQPPSTTCAWGNPFTDTNGTIYTAKLQQDTRSGFDYVYESADGTTYSLYTHLENENDPAIDSTIVIECKTGIACNYKTTSTNTY